MAAMARRSQYAKQLGVEAQKEPALFSLVDAMLQMDLPYPWRETVDEKHREYFYNAATGTATWTHPLHQVHSVIVDAARRVVASNEPKAAAISELEVFAREVETELLAWREVVAAEGEPYYYNMDTQETSWQNPRERLIGQLSSKANLLSAAAQAANSPQQLQATTKTTDIVKSYTDPIAELEDMTRDVEEELRQWREVVPEDGSRPYFYHVVLRETSAENPRDMLLAKLKAKAESLGFKPDLMQPIKRPANLQNRPLDALENTTRKSAPEEEDMTHSVRVVANGKSQDRHRNSAALKIQCRWRRWKNIRIKETQALLAKVRAVQFAHAARFIQRCWRRHAEIQRWRVAAATELQSRCRSYLAQAALRRLDAFTKEEKRIRGAASTVQAVCRCFLAIQDLEFVRLSAVARNYQAAVVLQRHWRGTRRRKLTRQERLEFAMATKIQALVRRSKSRTELASRRQCQAEARKHLALVFLAAENAHIARQERIALLIQRCIRGFAGRKKFKRKLTEKILAEELFKSRNRSALRIQSKWKSWMAWRKYQGLRRKRKIREGAVTKVTFHGSSGGVWLGPPGSRLGLEVDENRKVALVDAKGLVAAWNRINRGHEVRPGDQVLSVNGVSDADGIAKELTGAGVVDIILRRPGASCVGPQLNVDRSKGTALGVRGSSLGLELDPLTLAVTRINAGGVLALWNADNLSKAICSGDRVLAVNGQTEVDEIFEALGGTCVVELTIDRPPPPTPPGSSSEESSPTVVVGDSDSQESDAKQTANELIEVAMDLPSKAHADTVEIHMDAESTMLQESSLRKMPPPLASPSAATGYEDFAAGEIPAGKSYMVDVELDSAKIRHSSISTRSTEYPDSVPSWQSAQSERCQGAGVADAETEVAEPQSPAQDVAGAPGKAELKEDTVGSLSASASAETQLQETQVEDPAMSRQVQTVNQRGRLFFDSATGIARLRNDIKFRIRLFAPGRVDSPTAQFDNPIDVTRLFEDVVELFKLFPGTVEVLQFNTRPQAGEPSLGAAHEKWKQALAKNRSERVKRALEDAGIPKGLCVAKVEDSDHHGMVFRYLREGLQHTSPAPSGKQKKLGAVRSPAKVARPNRGTSRPNSCSPMNSARGNGNGSLKIWLPAKAVQRTPDGSPRSSRGCTPINLGSPSNSGGDSRFASPGKVAWRSNSATPRESPSQTPRQTPSPPRSQSHYRSRLHPPTSNCSPPRPQVLPPVKAGVKQPAPKEPAPPPPSCSNSAQAMLMAQARDMRRELQQCGNKGIADVYAQFLEPMPRRPVAGSPTRGIASGSVIGAKPSVAARGARAMPVSPLVRSGGRLMGSSQSSPVIR